MNCKNNSGFLLMELMIALTVLIGISGVIAYYFNGISQWNREVALRLKAHNEVNLLFERCVYEKKIVEPSVTLPNGMKIVAQELPMVLEPQSNFVVSEQEPIPFSLVEIVATWTSAHGQEKTFTLVAGFVR